MAELDVRPVPSVTTPEVVDERAARAELRRQVADLERRLSDAVCSSFPHGEVPHRVARLRGGPRVLGLGELEVLRDDLAARLHEAQAALEVRGARQEEARARLEAMLLEPGRHRFHQVRREDLGEHGCGAYQVRPRLGLVGLLAGWWHVKLSSGCPLGGPPHPPAPRGRSAARPHRGAAGRAPRADQAWPGPARRAAAGPVAPRAGR